MLELKNITLKWNSPTEKTLIKNLSIKIENSEILCVFGESGVGKSSLINVISGVNEENLNIEGEIKLNGIKLNNIPNRKKKNWASTSRWHFISSFDSRTKSIVWNE
mgnify:CR=1 FL=1